MLQCCKLFMISEKYINKEEIQSKEINLASHINPKIRSESN